MTIWPSPRLMRMKTAKLHSRSWLSRRTSTRKNLRSTQRKNFMLQTLMAMGGWTRTNSSASSIRTSARKCCRWRPSISCSPSTKTGMESSVVRSSSESFSLTLSCTTMQPLPRLPTTFWRWTQIRTGIWSLQSCTSSTLGGTTPAKRSGIFFDWQTPMATAIYQCKRPRTILTTFSSTRPRTCIFRDGMSCRILLSGCSFPWGLIYEAPCL
mmetsp:Transcript_26784/g.61251  ORF Transcript_26784/g.61251 Transcript_26784/m.61251 type:complete len:211 (-) Transcript_26784:1-633(-)